MSPNAQDISSTITSSGSPSSMRSRWPVARHYPCHAGLRPQACRSDCRWWRLRAARRSFLRARKCWKTFWAYAARRRSTRGQLSMRLLRSPVRSRLVLQLQKHRQRKTVDHFRFVERDKFRLVQHRVDQRAEHHLKREADAALLRRDPAPAHPRQQQRHGELDHRTSGGADRSPLLGVNTLILRGRADDADVTPHDIDGPFDDPPASLLQPRTEILPLPYPRPAGRPP